MLFLSTTPQSLLVFSFVNWPAVASGLLGGGSVYLAISEQDKADMARLRRITGIAWNYIFLGGLAKSSWGVFFFPFFSFFFRSSVAVTLYCSVVHLGLIVRGPIWLLDIFQASSIYCVPLWLVRFSFRIFLNGACLLKIPFFGSWLSDGPVTHHPLSFLTISSFSS